MMLTRTALRAHSAPICFTNRRCLSGSARLFVASEAAATRKEGDISSVFRSLSGGKDEALPPRFADVKKKLLGSKDQLQASWVRLLERLAEENEIIRAAGNKVIPEINFADIGSPSAEFDEAIRRRGVAIVRQVVPEAEARAYKDEIEEYVRLNPWTKAFPPHDPQVYELYWSRPQLRARAHPNMIATQRFLMQYWHTNNPEAEISTKDPVTYADRLRIRQPGDAGFALGPHVDGGSVERWEENGYGQGHVYDKIFEGKWEEFDSWEAGTRINAVSDLYHGAGSCSMLRLFQGWLSMSKTAPKEGTLLVNPLLSLSTAYMLLRPFFIPRSQPISDTAGEFSKEFLSPQNWVLEDDVSSNLQGAFPGHSQELNNILHPHLDLQHSMVHVPNITPGDYVAWHCDSKSPQLVGISWKLISNQPSMLLISSIKARLTLASSTSPRVQRQGQIWTICRNSVTHSCRASRRRTFPAAKERASTQAARHLRTLKSTQRRTVSGRSVCGPLIQLVERQLARRE
ncbi:hypothetical protein FH972_025959 [Carpinus fangiana]|uniref:DUF1479-domain-containing protein n=1 Tax=Carpinus fangiana TaxID=176857 RepID=A0A5N6L558_9ROSI|nr:hypothetical protein FH972_025959 [Carpinus fangiana]